MAAGGGLPPGIGGGRGASGRGARGGARARLGRRLRDPPRRGAADVVARAHRAFQAQHLEHVRPDRRAEAAQRLQRHVGQVGARGHARGDGLAHHLVRVAKRHALAHQVVGEVGGGREAAARGLAQGGFIDGQRRHHVGEGVQRVAHRVDGVEQRLLVLLVVLVVCQRLRLHQHQQAHQVAGDASALAAHQLGYVRVLLLRHDRGAGAEAVGQVHEAELRRGPQHQFLAEAREVGHQQRGEGAELDREIAVGDRVEAVARGCAEAELGRGEFAVDRIAGSGERRGAEWRDVHARAAVEQARVVALQHLVPCQHVVTEGHGLGGLQVREARHDGRGLARGELDQSLLQARELGGDGIDLVAQVQAHIGGDLVVARAPGVQLLARDADARGEARLDVHVHVLELHAPLEAAFLDLAADLAEARDDRRVLLRAQQPGAGEHRGVGQRAADVVQREAAVEVHRGGEALHEGIGALAETPSPEGRSLLLFHGFP